MVTKPNAPSAERNKGAILEVISEEFQDCKAILEIGSGTGQHAVFFASRMPWLTWQPSDVAANHEGINAWREDARLDNVKIPLILDVEEPPQTEDKYDGVFSANTAHIMGITAVKCMFRFVAQYLTKGGKFCLYGPFKLNGNFTSDSNRDFDANLKSRDSAMGVRDIEVLDKFAEANEMVRADLYAMPSNNFLAVWVKS